MIALDTDQWTCAVCGELSEQMHVEIGLPEEPPDFDSRPGEPVRSTIGHWVHECPHCRYIAPDLRISNVEAGPIVRGETYARLHDDQSMSTGTRRFLCHALILETVGDFADAGWTCLHGAWIADDGDDVNAATHCRNEAIRLWKHGKQHGQNFGEGHAHEFAVVTDVHRRAGDFEAARDACLEALSGEVDPLIEDMLRMQLALIQRHDTACHSLREVLDRRSGGDRVTLH